MTQVVQAIPTNPEQERSRQLEEGRSRSRPSWWATRRVLTHTAVIRLTVQEAHGPSPLGGISSHGCTRRNTKSCSVSPQLTGNGSCHSSRGFRVHLAGVEAILKGVAGVHCRHQSGMSPLQPTADKLLGVALRLIMADNQESLSHT